MKNLFNRLLFFIILLIGLVGCHEDFFEVDLSKYSITVISPADNDSTDVYLQVFWWDKLKGVEKYNFQLIRGDFNAIRELVVDTNISLNQFQFTLPPGNYKWRIKGYNYSSETPYVVRSLMIDSALNLSQQSVQLISPNPNTFSENLIQTFKWVELPFSDNYTIEISELNGNVLHVKANITGNTYSYQLPNFGNFIWRLYAQNESGKSKVSQKNFYLSPPPSTLVLPNEGDTLNFPIHLNWIRSASQIVGDSIYLDTTPNFTSTALKSFYGQTQSFQLVNGLSGVRYYWRLKSFDQFSNASRYSTISTFVTR